MLANSTRQVFDIGDAGWRTVIKVIAFSPNLGSAANAR
jgi:hypothetical protein